MAYQYRGSEYNDQKLPLIPEGAQEMMIETIEEVTAKSGNPMLAMKLRMDDKHLRIYHTIVLNNEWTTKNIGDLLASMGRDPKSDVAVEWSDLKGEWVKAKVFHEVYNGNLQAKVKFFMANQKQAPKGEEIPF